MDGTLVDSDAAVQRIWAVFAQRFGLDAHDVYLGSQGVRMIETVRHHAPHADAEAVAADLMAIELADLAGTEPLPGAAALLAALDGAPTALVTSATRDLARARMTAAGLPMPPVLVGADDVPVGKPDPAPYLLAARELGVDPADCIVFEDAAAGIHAGLAAGAQVVIVGDAPWTDRPLPRIRDHSGTTVRRAGDRIELELG